MKSLLAVLLWTLQVSLLLSNGASGFSWGGSKANGRRVQPADLPSSMSYAKSIPIVDDSTIPRMYAIALTELQELESEPLCHRTAALLLVNNCQLLDGRDDATILTDSGRAARDFVDSYAASLAICDLERGSFIIPSTCSKFQESVLARMSPPTKPQLHVTTSEITACLQGLAQSDSAWNTWVSYRHKSLRFCEAARADHEKDANIRVHQRLTNILAKMTVQLEEETEERLQSMNQMFREAWTTMESLKPRMKDLQDGIIRINALFNDQIVRDVQQSAEFVSHGLDDARQLQKLLATLVVKTQNQNRDLATSHESTLQEVTLRLNTEADVILAALAAAVASSTSLHREIENSQYAAAAVALRQEKIETGMQKLEGLAESLLVQHRDHQQRLNNAQQTASDLMGILDSASTTAVTLRSSIYNSLGWGSWWPFVFCPLTSLVVGSYGLPPSAIRNVVLVSLGEMAGLGVSIAKHYGNDIYAAFTPTSKSPISKNSTTVSNEAIFSNTAFTHDNFQQVKLNEVF